MKWKSKQKAPPNYRLAVLIYIQSDAYLQGECKKSCWMHEAPIMSSLFLLSLFFFSRRVRSEVHKRASISSEGYVSWKQLTWLGYLRLQTSV